MSNNWMTKREFTASEIRAACKGAKDHWDDLSANQVAAIDAIAEMADDIVDETGLLVLTSGTIWDYIGERIGERIA